MGFIGRSVLSGGCLFALYSALIASGALEGVLEPDGMWHANVVKAEELIYRRQAPDTVVVGSSLATRLEVSLLPPGVHNLALGGKSLFDGLHLLELMESTPRLVLVEVNLPFRPGDPDFVEPLFTPGVSQLKRYAPALRDQYRPVTNTMRALIALSRRFRGRRSPHPPLTPLTPELFELLVARVVQSHQRLPAKDRARASISELKRIVDRLQERGTTVVFFEMPTHPEVGASPLYRHTRQMLEAALPAKTYRYLPPPNCAEFHTTDGIHLAQPSAARYSRTLAALLEAL